MQAAESVPQAALKKWVGVEVLLEVERCPWAEQREKGWRWWMRMKEVGGQQQQKMQQQQQNLFVKRHRLVDSERGKAGQ